MQMLPAGQRAREAQESLQHELHGLPSCDPLCFMCWYMLFRFQTGRGREREREENESGRPTEGG